MDNKGQVQLVGVLAVGAIVGVIAIVVFATVYGTINKATLSSGAQGLLGIIDLVLAATILVAITAGMLLFFRA